MKLQSLVLAAITALTVNTAFAVPQVLGQLLLVPIWSILRITMAPLQMER